MRLTRSCFGVDTTTLPRLLWILALALVVFSGCDGGLDPAMIQDSEISLSGTLTYRNPASRPPRDSMVDMRVVAFREIPRDSNIVLAVLGGMAYYNDVSLVDSTRYRFIVNLNDSLANAGATFKYICLAQQTGSNVFTDWRLIAVYSLTGDYRNPTPITLRRGTKLSGINFTVDWQNIPPPPYR